jgi:hypothetical protein
MTAASGLAGIGLGGWGAYQRNGKHPILNSLRALVH